MAALNFPSSPSVGQTYPSPAVSGQPVYTWDGEKWVGGTGGGNIYIADSAPAAPVGSLWWESDTGTLYVRYNDGNSIQWVAILGPSTPPAPRKNYIVNGAMMVSQEFGSAAVATNNYVVDQFLQQSTHGGVTTQQQVASPTPGGSPNRIRVTVTTADTSVGASEYLQFAHPIEGLRVADLRMGTASAKTVTLRFGVRAPAGTYCVSFRNGATNRTYVAEYVVTAGEANTDTMKSITVALDQTGTWASDNTQGLGILWQLLCGSTWQTATPNIWQAAAFNATANQFNFMGTVGNTFELFDVSLTEGTVAPPFQVPDYPSELALCQRYYEKLGTGQIGMGQCATTTSAVIHLQYVEKRALPTLGATLPLTVYNAGTGTLAVTSVTASLVAPTPTRAECVANVASGLVAGNATHFMTLSTGFISLNARL